MCVVLQSCSRPSIGMGRIQALSVEAWLLSSLALQSGGSEPDFAP